jgi:hypothetical protein
VILFALCVFELKCSFFAHECAKHDESLTNCTYKLVAVVQPLQSILAELLRFCIVGCKLQEN